jgi:tetratricopeptide (TPR) repeat protein
MRKTALTSLLVLSCLLLVQSTALAGDKWVKISSKNFTVVGNANEEDMRKVVTRLEEFRQVLSMIFPNSRIATPVPTTVYIFKNHEAFAPYKPKYKGKTQEAVAGYFINGPDMNLIALTTDKRAANPYEVIFHEYEHFVLHNNLDHIPLWLDEGLAEFYSTFDASGDDLKISIGAPISRHLITLTGNPLLPLKTLLAVDHKSSHYNEGSKTGLFYAESWALVHYLLLGADGKHTDQLSRFISGLNSDLPIEENFRQSFQIDFKTMESELRDYIRKFAFPTLIGTFPKQLEYARDTQSSVLPDAEVEYYLGYLLLRNNRPDEAEAHLTKSLDLNSRLAASQVALALVRLRQERRGAAEKLLESARQADPKNYSAYYLYAEILARQNRYAEALKYYQQATQLQPNLAYLYADLGYAYLELEKDAEALEAYKQGVQLDPRNYFFYRSRSYVYLRLARGIQAATDALSFLQRLGWREDDSTYMALVAYFGYRQAGRGTAAEKLLDEALTKLDSAAWPYPVARYLKRELKEEDLLALATNTDKLTEAHAYIGLDLSLSGERAAALPHLRWVRDNGNKKFVEYPLALAELARLETATAKPPR